MATEEGIYKRHITLTLQAGYHRGLDIYNASSQVVLGRHGAICSHSFDACSISLIPTMAMPLMLTAYL
jgi:hypothetical protein